MLDISCEDSVIISICSCIFFIVYLFVELVISELKSNTEKMTDESWRDYNVAQRNLHMLNSESMADCTFVVGIGRKKKFQCHKSILSHGSSVFYAMFNGGLQEKGEVKVEDIEPQHFRKMLEYIYSDNTDLENVESALCVCYAANKYMINTLIVKCIHFIKENLDPDIVCRALEFARFIDNADLEVESLHYLQTNTHDVLKSESFVHAEKTTLLTILEQDHLWIPYEVEVFSACMRWARAQGGTADNLREVLGPEVLGLIRFLTMTAQEFASVVVPSKLLQFNTSEVFNSASFPNVEKTTLLIILNQDNICVDSQVEIFSACIRWAKAQQRDDKVALRDVLGPLSFPAKFCMYKSHVT